MEQQALKEHAARIERLQMVDREVILATRIHGLIMGVKNKELTIEDVTQMTNISREQFLSMMEKA